jgi:hypothetical protein
MRSLNGAADWSDMSDWSDYDDAASDTSDGDAAENSYFEWCDELADRDELLAAQHRSAASSSARDAARGSSEARSAHAGGRPPVVPMDEATLRWLCLEGYANSQIAAYFGTTVKAVEHKKAWLGLTRLGAVQLPPVDVLQAVLGCKLVAVRAEAWQYHVVCGGSRNVMLAPNMVALQVPPPERCIAAQQICGWKLTDVDMRQVGVQFALALLHTERGIVARHADVNRALRAHHPSGHQKPTIRAATS